MKATVGELKKRNRAAVNRIKQSRKQKHKTDEAWL